MHQRMCFLTIFPPEDPIKFTNVHKIFGASNVSKLLNEIEPHQREDAVNSLAYEAEARLKDPVYGCVGAISVLQRQVLRLQKELDATNADLIRFSSNQNILNMPQTTSGNYPQTLMPCHLIMVLIHGITTLKERNKKVHKTRSRLVILYVNICSRPFYDLC
ncbi:putative transcription factor AS2-LOB family [Helianthus annuus]|nr:putative transcription factor AS2-LOB family [Helianthus annuus]